MSSRLSRGLRNLNPGNIRRSSVRYKGEKSHSTDSAFKQFESLEAGYRAMFVLLHTYFVRLFRVMPLLLRTIQRLILPASVVHRELVAARLSIPSLQSR